MIVLAIATTLGAIVLLLFVLYANSMASSPQPFRGRPLIIGSWIVVLLTWLMWYFK